ncbi:biotin/lipoyl-binding protein [bacterium]|nr:biotin/lipoyl-binding protein [bacterium]
MELKIRDESGCVHTLEVDTVSKTVSLNGAESIPYQIIRGSEGIEAVRLDHRRLPVEFSRDGIRLSLLLDGVSHALERETTYAFLQRAKEGPQQGRIELRSPIPGIISAVEVTKGEKVKKGDVLVVLQAMKMENEISSPASGVVSELLVVEGEKVAIDHILLIIKA